MGGIVLSSTYYWYLWQHLGIDFLRGFQIYINGCIIVSAIGLLVFVDSLFPFGFYSVANSVINLGRLENDFGVRIAATFGEPTYFATTVALRHWLPFNLFSITLELSQKTNGTAL